MTARRAAALLVGAGLLWLDTAAAASAADAPLFSFQDSRVAESSSLVSTPAGPWLWTANDSGDTARLFAVDRSGRTLAVAALPGTEVTDVEDSALGPDRTLYVGDIGDNGAVRTSVAVLRVPEPAVDPRRTGVRVTTAPPRRAVLTYEDGPHDAETLLVHPRTGQVLVVTKGVFGSTVYAAPQPLADGVLRRVGSVSFRVTGTPGGPSPQVAAQLLATGGSVAPDGSRLVIRTYTDAYVWPVPGDDLVAALRGTPQVLPLPASKQGEAVTWSRDGSTLLTSSEGVRAPVFEVAAPVVGAAPTPAGLAPASTVTPLAIPTARPSAGPGPTAATPGRGPGRAVPYVGAVLAAGAVATLVALSRRRKHG